MDAAAHLESGRCLSMPIGLERAVSTTFSFVKNNYKGKELKVVYQELIDDWDEETTGVAFPTKGRENNKDQYTIAIIKARELLIASDPRWAENTKREINQRNQERNNSAMESINGRLQDISRSLFCNLSISDGLCAAHSMKYRIGQSIPDTSRRSINPSRSMDAVKVRRTSFHLGRNE